MSEARAAEVILDALTGVHHVAHDEREKSLEYIFSGTRALRDAALVAAPAGEDQRLDFTAVCTEMASIGAIESVLSLLDAKPSLSSSSAERLLRLLESMFADAPGCARGGAMAAQSIVSCIGVDHDDSLVQLGGLDALGALTQRCEHSRRVMGVWRPILQMLTNAVDYSSSDAEELAALRVLENVSATVPASAMLDAGAADVLLSYLRRESAPPAPQGQAAALSVLRNIFTSDRGGGGDNHDDPDGSGAAFGLRVLRSSVEAAAAAALRSRGGSDVDVAHAATGLLLLLLTEEEVSLCASGLNKEALRRAIRSGAVADALVAAAAHHASSSHCRSLVLRLDELDASNILLEQNDSVGDKLVADVRKVAVVRPDKRTRDCSCSLLT